MLITEGNGPLKSKENAKKGFQIVLDATVAQSFVHWRQQKGRCLELFIVISWLYTRKSINVKDEIQLLFIFHRAGRGKRDTNSSFVGLISNVRPTLGASKPIESLSGRPQGGIQ